MWSFLGRGGMPMAVIGGTVAFPIALGIGAMMTWIADVFPVRALAVAPALWLCAMVAQVCRQAMLGTLNEVDDADELAPLPQLAQQAKDRVLQVLALGGTFAGPGAVALYLDQPQVGLVLLLAGACLLPLSAALLLATGDRRALSPAVLLRVATRVGASYWQTVGVIVPLCIPALVVLALGIGLPAYVVASFVGALGVGPALMAARAMGVVLQERRTELDGLFALPTAEPVELKGRPASPPPEQPQQ